MAKAGGGGGAGAGGNGALTWVVSGGPVGGGGPGRGIVPGPRRGWNSAGQSGGWGEGKRGKFGVPNGRPVGASASRIPRSPPLFFLYLYGGSGCGSIMCT